MRRRRFIAVLAMLVAATRVAAREGRVYRVGYLGSGSPTTSGRWLAAFRNGLRKLGYVDGENMAIDYQWAEGHFERLAHLAQVVIDHEPQVIVGFGGPQVARALKSATATIPVVFLTDDPVAEGIVASMARPGGNLTGVGVLSNDLEAKRVELVREALPQATRIAALHNPNDPRSRDSLATVRATAAKLSLAVAVAEARSVDEVDGALAQVAEAKADALLVMTDPMLNTERVRIVAFAAAEGIPGFYFWREFGEAGGLVSYGPSLGEMHGRMAAYVDKILRGEKPGDLPIEQPTRFELVVNLSAARSLGITLPMPLLARTDEVIE
jgi:putative tryptophan/tyrosine transport system substrate-binding protein